MQIIKIKYNRKKKALFALRGRGGKVEAAEYKYPVYPNSPEWEAIDIQNEIRTLIVADGFPIYKVLSVGDKSNGNFSMKK